MFSRSRMLVLLSAMVLLSACGKKVSFQDEAEQAVKSKIFAENIAYRAQPHGFFSMGPMTSAEKEQMMMNIEKDVHVMDLKCNDVPGKGSIQRCNAIFIDKGDSNGGKELLDMRMTRGDNGSLIVISLSMKKYDQ